MKKLLLAGVLFVATNVMAQKNIPDAAKASFAKEFPGVTVKGWDKEDGKFEAEFEKDGKEMSAVFTANGIFEEKEMAIPVSELPAAATEYITKTHSGSKIKEASVIIKADGSKWYEAEVNGKDLIFDANGNFSKKDNDNEASEVED